MAQTSIGYDHFNEIAKLYDSFADNPDDTALAHRFGAPTDLNPDDISDQAMLAGISKSATQFANAMRYLALLDLNAEPDLRPDAPCAYLPELAVLQDVLRTEIAHMAERLKTDVWWVTGTKLRARFELCVDYLNQSADPMWYSRLPKRLS